MSLSEIITQDLKAAMKAQDTVSLRGIRAIKAALQLAATDGSGQEMTTDREVKLIQKLVKQRQDSLSIFEQQKREDLAVIEREEIEVLQRYLPKALSLEDLEKAIQEVIESTGASSMKDMGAVMAAANAKLAGAADGKAVSEVVRRLLS
ncbi:MAG: GatB/YqeY domain-containing protein [Saprospiraceae bacterium]